MSCVFALWRLRSRSATRVLRCGVSSPGFLHTPPSSSCSGWFATRQQLRNQHATLSTSVPRLSQPVPRFTKAASRDLCARLLAEYALRRTSPSSLRPCCAPVSSVSPPVCCRFHLASVVTNRWTAKYSLPLPFTNGESPEGRENATSMCGSELISPLTTSQQTDTAWCRNKVVCCVAASMPRRPVSQRRSLHLRSLCAC